MDIVADCPNLQQFRQHPNHQEVECHERDMPKDEKMTEASLDEKKIIV